MLIQGGEIPLPQKWTVVVPTNITLVGKRSEDRKVYLNLNWYRNENFHILNKVKKLFAEQVQASIEALPKFEAVHLIYEVYAGTAREFDVANVGSIVDKFFSDALVSADKLEDDNYNVVLSASYRYGGITKGNPHCLVHIHPVLSLSTLHLTGETMQITLVQSEIETALRNYVTSLLNVREGHRIDITLKATRGEDGSTALIDIVPDTPAKVEQAQTMVKPVVRSPAVQRPSSSPVTAEETTKPVGSDDAVTGDQSQEEGASVQGTQAESSEASTGTEAAPSGVRPTSLFPRLQKPGAAAQAAES